MLEESPPLTVPALVDIPLELPVDEDPPLLEPLEDPPLLEPPDDPPLLEPRDDPPPLELLPLELLPLVTGEIFEGAVGRRNVDR